MLSVDSSKLKSERKFVFLKFWTNNWQV